MRIRTGITALTQTAVTGLEVRTSGPNTIVEQTSERVVTGLS